MLACSTEYSTLVLVLGTSTLHRYAVMHRSTSFLFSLSVSVSVVVVGCCYSSMHSFWLLTSQILCYCYCRTHQLLSHCGFWLKLPGRGLRFGPRFQQPGCAQLRGASRRVRCRKLDLNRNRIGKIEEQLSNGLIFYGSGRVNPKKIKVSNCMTVF